MKPGNVQKTATIVLWLSMTVTLSIFAFFYFGQLSHPATADSREVSALLYCLYILFFATALTASLFTLVRFFQRMKDSPRTAWKSFIPALLTIALFAITYLAGSGNFWEKLTDMWLYAIYFLLGITFVSVLAGIVWSYFKKS